MQMTDPDEKLDAFFDAGRSHGPEVSDTFMARLETDMEAALPKPSEPVFARPGPAMTWLWRSLTASGLSGAAVLGVWIGFVAPDILNGVVALDADETIALYTFLPGAELAGLSE